VSSALLCISFVCSDAFTALETDLTDQTDWTDRQQRVITQHILSAAFLFLGLRPERRAILLDLVFVVSSWS
jgi:hypothetical protein